MDYAEFTILRLRGEDDPYPSPACFALLPGRWRQRMRSRWLMWRLPVACAEILCLHRTGEELLLPFTAEELGAYKKEELTDMLHRIILERGAQNMVTDRVLEPYLEKSFRIDGRMIPLLMTAEIVAYACRKHQIARKECRPVVIASGYAETAWVLQCLGTDLNRLTIVAKDAEEYEAYARRMYEEQGLLVSVRERPLAGELCGNLVLELSDARERDYRFYRSGSVVLNLSGSAARTLDAYVHRKDLVLYNRFDIRAGDAVWDNRILQAVIYKTSTWMGAGQLKKGEKIRKLYGLAVEKAGLEA